MSRPLRPAGLRVGGASNGEFIGARTVTRAVALRRAVMRALAVWQRQSAAACYHDLAVHLARHSPPRAAALPQAYLLMAADCEAFWLLVADRRSAEEYGTLQRWRAYLQRRKQRVRSVRVETPRDAWEQVSASLFLQLDESAKARAEAVFSPSLAKSGRQASRSFSMQEER